MLQVSSSEDTCSKEDLGSCESDESSLIQGFPSVTHDALAATRHNRPATPATETLRPALKPSMHLNHVASHPLKSDARMHDMDSALLHSSSMHGRKNSFRRDLTSVEDSLYRNVWMHEVSSVNLGQEARTWDLRGLHSTWSLRHLHITPLSDSDRWALISMAVITCLALCFNWVDSQMLIIFNLMVLWTVSSVGMNIVNKMALKVLPLPMTVLIIQMSIAIFLLLVICGPLSLLKEIRAHAAVSIRWSLLASFFAGGLITSMKALEYGSVTFLLIIRNIMPLFSLLVERHLLPHGSTREITVETVLALVSLAFGTVLYASYDLHISHDWNALGWVFLNMVVMISYRLVERRLLWDMPRTISFGALTLMQNLAGLLPIVVLFFAWGEHAVLWKNPELLRLDHRQDPMDAACILYSGCAGLALGFYSTKLQKEITATTMLALQSSMKIMIIFLAMVVLGEHLGSWSAVGCSISLLGGIWYARVVSRPEASESGGKNSEEKC